MVNHVRMWPSNEGSRTFRRIFIRPMKPVRDYVVIGCEWTSSQKAAVGPKLVDHTEKNPIRRRIVVCVRFRCINVLGSERQSLRSFFLVVGTGLSLTYRIGNVGSFCVESGEYFKQHFDSLDCEQWPGSFSDQGFTSVTDDGDWLGVLLLASLRWIPWSGVTNGIT